jgi:hypothetical protein
MSVATRHNHKTAWIRIRHISLNSDPNHKTKYQTANSSWRCCCFVVVLFLNLWDTAVQRPPACIPCCMPAEKWRSICFFHNVWTMLIGRRLEGKKRLFIDKNKANYEKEMRLTKCTVQPAKN